MLKFLSQHSFVCARLREREKEIEGQRQAIEERKRERRKLNTNTKMVCNPRTRRSEIETEKG